MKKLSMLVLCAVFSYSVVSAQKDTSKTILAGDEAKDFLKNSDFKFDSTAFLKEMAQGACKCIDSIALLKKTRDQYIKSIASCIDISVGAYSFGVQMYNVLRNINDTSPTKNIVLGNKGTTSYKLTYYKMENWLKDSCKSMNSLVASNDDRLKHSMSTNKDALGFYSLASKEIEAENYKDAQHYLEKALKIDPDFAFAWDNLGICNRQLGNYQAAIDAYKRSLALDPKGLTPLHNIPVAYEFQKEYDNALQAYLNILNYYPEDPEADYGAGRVYLFYLNDIEKALQYMCKAYNAYVKLRSPYRSDAEKQLSYIYSKMKEAKQLDRFNAILAENHIKNSD